MNPLFPIAFLDPPQVLTTSVTNIPGSGSPPLQVVSDIGRKASYAIDYIDTTGDFIGCYIGNSGLETLVCIIGGGLTERAYSVFHANARVSLRSMTASPITQGQLVMTFMGFGL